MSAHDAAPAPDIDTEELAKIGVEPDDPSVTFLIYIGVALSVALVGAVILGYGIFKWQTAVELEDKGYAVTASAPRADGKATVGAMGAAEAEAEVDAAAKDAHE